MKKITKLEIVKKKGQVYCYVRQYGYENHNGNYRIIKGLRVSGNEIISPRFVNKVIIDKNIAYTYLTEVAELAKMRELLIKSLSIFA